MKIDSWKDLGAYRAAFELQQEIFSLSRSWPKDEIYSLTDQIRRASRSVGANIVEAWAKRRYPAHFLSKLSDADGELQETLHWLDTAKACGYLPADTYEDLLPRAVLVGRQIGAMINKHKSFCF